VPEWLTLSLVLVVGLALAFDYINGFHDTANAIATSVSTRALRPLHAIGLSAAANFVGALAGTAVATTIASGLVDESLIDLGVVGAGLVGAITWNLFTWRLGIPSSSSHALIGGLLGASFAAAGLAAWNIEGILNKVLIPLFSSPLIGFLLGGAAMVLLLNVFRRAHPKRINERFRRAQIGSATFMAFSHGSNDAQKTMGIITLALVTTGAIDEFVVPTWVILASATAISLGTAAGGWRIIKTMGSKVVKLDPVHGFAAETTAALVILGASRLGVPVSTTHVISSAIMGVGTATRPKAVRWIVARSIGVAWILTIPASGLVAGLTFLVVNLLVGG